MFWRLPFGRKPPSWPPMAKEAQADYPALNKRFEALDALVLPAFTVHDERAIRAQRTHRRYHVVLIAGALATSVIAALQAVFESATWIGLIVTLVGGLTAVTANQQRREGPLARYLAERGKAERIRSLYFKYLSGVPPIDNLELEAKIADIEYPRSATKSTAKP